MKSRQVLQPFAQVFRRDFNRVVEHHVHKDWMKLKKRPDNRLFGRTPDEWRKETR
jgi:hypothetical protein